MEKSKEAAVGERNLALQEFEDSLKKLDNSGGSEDVKAASTSGRRVFGATKAQISDASNKVKSDNFYGGSDSEDDLGPMNGASDLLQMDVNTDSVLVKEDTDTHQESIFKVMKFLFFGLLLEVFVLINMIHLMHFLFTEH